MHFYIGIAPQTLNNDDFIVAALTYGQKAPDFSLYGMSLAYMREHFDATVFVRHTSLVRCINTAVNRSIEKLLIKNMIVPEKSPQVEILVRASLRGLNFVVPHQVMPKHWLLRASQRALDLWMQGA